MQTAASLAALRSCVNGQGSRELADGVGAHSLAEYRPVEWIAIPLGALVVTKVFCSVHVTAVLGLAPSRGGRAAHTHVTLPFCLFRSVSYVTERCDGTLLCMHALLCLDQGSPCHGVTRVM
jgi:hypothetical protein